MIITFLALITFSSTSKANNFRESIEIYGKKNSGTTSLIYIFNRLRKLSQNQILFGTLMK